MLVLVYKLSKSMGIISLFSFLFNNGRIFVTYRYLYSTFWELVSNFLHRRRKYTGEANLTGSIVVITGANSGIGKATTIEMIKRGSNVIIGCRDVDKGNKLIKEIWEKQPQAKLKFIHLDLASLESVREFVKQVSQIVPHIDILINNAGVLSATKSKTVDGFELHFGTNHLGHFLLTMLLLDHLVAAQKARVIMVSAKDYMFGKIFFNGINFDKKDSGIKAYCQSKLANILFAQELSLRLANTNVSTYSVHPGRVKTEFYRNFSSFDNFIFIIAQALLFVKPEVGAQTTLYCALDDSVANESGRYYDNCKLVEKTTSAVNNETAEKLWYLSCEMVKLENRLRLMK